MLHAGGGTGANHSSLAAQAFLIAAATGTAHFLRQPVSSCGPAYQVFWLTDTTVYDLAILSRYWLI